MKQTDLAAFIAQEPMRWAKTLHEAAHTTLTVVAEDTGPRHTRPLEVVTCEEALGPSGPPQGPRMPGYPEEPTKDTRYNLHLRAGELWELKAVVASMGLDLSHLLCQVWQAFRGSPQGQQALHKALPGLLSAAEPASEDLAREERG